MGIISRFGLIALIATAAAPTYAQDAEAPVAPGPMPVKVEDGTADVAEMKVFQETLGRYASRMKEFEEEAKAHITLREQEERGQLNRGYDALIAELSEDDQALRATAIKRFERFLDKYPRSPDSAHVMFRLAELYFEQSEEDWLLADAEYRRAMDTMSDDELDALPEEPAKNYKKSIRLYKRIIRDYPEYQYLDGCHYMLGYCYTEPSEQQDEDGGLAQFQSLVDKFPDSEFAAAAHLRIGEYYFDYNDVPKAIPHYEAVINLEGESGKQYGSGLYKLAWSYYKLSEYDRALALLNQLLDWSSDVHMAKRGQESAYAPEAVEYTAISFSDIADRMGNSPLDVAQAFYAQVGERQFEDRVYKRLADVLTQQARYDDAIVVYDYIQTRWADDPENPDYQWKIATLHMSTIPPDPEAAQAAVAELTERYNDESSWWRANRANPDALNVASRYIEQSLASVAAQYHTQANDSGEPAAFGKAADLYKEYLTKFPFADDYYTIEWWLADTLNKAGRTAEAREHFVQLRKAGKHNYGEPSLWALMQLSRQQVINQFGTMSTLPPTAEVESTVPMPKGGERTVYKLGAEHDAFVQLADELVAADFAVGVARAEAQLAAAKTDEEKEQLSLDLEQLQVFEAALDANRHALAYEAAQVLYSHGRMEDARPRLETIIATWPGKNEAAFAASLIVESYLDEGDLVKVRAYASKYAGERLGADEALSAERERIFGTQVEGATFKLALQHVELGDRLAAAEAFLSFRSEFPESKYAEDALYNAANSYEIVGRVEDSIRLFEQYVKEYPDADRSRGLFFRLAVNYAQALELERAVEYYEELYRKTKGAGVEYADAPGALFNAGFLRIGMGDYAGAAKNFERYTRENGEQPDAEGVLFMAGEQWERVGEREALRFYERYLRAYQDFSPDHTMEALYKIATITEKSGRPRDVERAWSDLSAAYARLAPGGEVSSLGRHYAAHAAFRPLLPQLEDFKQIKFSSNEEKNADLLLTVKKNALADLERQGTEIIQTYQDFEYSAAALYVIGSSYLAYADMLFQAPPPKGLDDEMLMLYEEAIDELRVPLEDKGRARLEAVLESAKTQKRWSQWQVNTLIELNTRFPSDFALDKNEFRAVGSSDIIPGRGPISIAPAEVEDAPPEDGPSTPEPAGADPAEPGPAASEDVPAMPGLPTPQEGGQ